MNVTTIRKVRAILEVLGQKHYQSNKSTKPLNLSKKMLLGYKCSDFHVLFQEALQFLMKAVPFLLRGVFGSLESCFGENSQFFLAMNNVWTNEATRV